MADYSIDVHIYMEKGMYGRLVDRAQELGMPLSAVVRDAVVQYFENVPEVHSREQAVASPEDPIWQLPDLSQAYGPLSVPGMAARDNSGEGSRGGCARTREMTRSIFVNTTGWLALYNPNDANHQAARHLWEDWRGEPVRLVTTDYVLDQVYTALKMFGSLHTAQAFHQVITNSDVVRVFMTDSVIFDRAWKVFLDDEQPSWTFTDCINYSVIHYLGLTETFTFDPNFSAPGLIIVPSLGE